MQPNLQANSAKLEIRSIWRHVTFAQLL